MLHEVNYGGYRMMVIGERDRVCLISRGGNDWAHSADRLPPMAVPKAIDHACDQFYSRLQMHCP
jgi:ATP-dependent DNA ligase